MEDAGPSIMTPADPIHAVRAWRHSERNLAQEIARASAAALEVPVGIAELFVLVKVTPAVSTDAMMARRDGGYRAGLCEYRQNDFVYHVDHRPSGCGFVWLCPLTKVGSVWMYTW